MTNVKFLGVDPNTSLADINKIVAQWERVVGALVAMGHSLDDPATPAPDPKTVLGFDAAKHNPSPPAVIVAKPPNGLPSSITPICEGFIYVAGTLTDCVAYRP